jgi:aldehyde dehydrogenase (NAD+)
VTCKILRDLADGRSVFTDGTWAAGQGESFTCVNPATEEPLAALVGASRDQVDAAVKSARRAGYDWSHTEAADRGRLLVRLAELIEEQASDLADLVVAEVGSPITLARDLQVRQPSVNFRWSADAATRGPMGGYVQNLPPGVGVVRAESRLLREPIGVVAAIVPYNYPLNMISWKVGPALAAGCSVVVLPSPRGSLCALAFARIVEQAGLPPGLVNVVVGGASVGESLVSNELVDMVSFTGSNAVGARVMSLAAQHSAKVTLELGGKSPNIVLPSACLEDTIAPSVLRFTRNAGQGCGATTRILVHDAQYDEFVDRAADFISNRLAVGDPTLPTTDVGPLISSDHRARVESYLERSVRAGARIIVGGNRPLNCSRGFFLAPALLANVAATDEICQEELFAPVAVVLRYSNIQEAIEIANSTRYGLNAVIWGDEDEALSVAERIDTGTIAINGGGDMRPDVPWGGVKQSGVGCEMGDDGFREFFRVRHLTWRSL